MPHAEAVTSYTAKCTEDVSVTKTTTLSNKEPWLTKEVYSLLMVYDATHSTGDIVALHSAMFALNNRDQSMTPTHLQEHLCDIGDTRHMRYRTQALMD